MFGIESSLSSNILKCSKILFSEISIFQGDGALRNEISSSIRFTLLMMSIVLIFFPPDTLTGRRGYGKIMQVRMVWIRSRNETMPVRMFWCRSADGVMQVPRCAILVTGTLSGNEGTHLRNWMLSAKCVGNNLTSHKFSFLSGPSLWCTHHGFSKPLLCRAYKVVRIYAKSPYMDLPKKNHQKMVCISLKKVCILALRFVNWSFWLKER